MKCSATDAPRYDWLIVGAGLFGCVFARQMTDAGFRCLIIDRRKHLAGNAHDELREGIRMHCYGAHVFHTNDAEVWQYVNRFARFNSYVHTVQARNGAQVYPLPFNMNTFVKLWGNITPEQARQELNRQTAPYRVHPAEQLEQQALALVGPDLYETLVRHYTEKQWGRPCRELPAFLIRRLPLRFTYDNRYFSDRYQGLPVEGYDALCACLLEGVEVRLGTDYESFQSAFPAAAAQTMYTGAIDAFFHECLGTLQYRSLRFETQVLATGNAQGCAVINDTSAQVPWTRTIEHRHFYQDLAGGEELPEDRTIVTWEYPCAWKPGMEPFYPINDEKNQRLYDRYVALAAQVCPQIHFGGRQGSYRYCNMDQVIRAALDAAKALQTAR